MVKETIKTFVTKCPMYSLWFKRYVKGMHSCMGDDRCPDTAISTEVMLEITNRKNVNFVEGGAWAGLLFLGAYLGSLRGEEVPRIIQHHFIKLNEESMKHKKYPDAV